MQKSSSGNMVLIVAALIVVAMLFYIYFIHITLQQCATERFSPLIERKAMSKPINYNNFDVYLINLDRNTERLDTFINQYMNCDLRFKQVKRFSAVDGQTIENIESKLTPKAWHEIQEVERTGYRTKHYQLTRGAVGCYMSHLGVYDLISKGSAEYGLIFEDDVIIDRQIFAKLNGVITQIPADWNILLLSCHCIVCDKMDNYYDTGRFFWLHCYIVKRDTARMLVHELDVKKKPIGKQIDSELSDMISEGKLKVYCLKTSLCRQSGIFPTTIQTPMKVVPGVNPYAKM